METMVAETMTTMTTHSLEEETEDTEEDSFHFREASAEVDLVAEAVEVEASVVSAEAAALAEAVPLADGKLTNNYIIKLRFLSGFYFLPFF